MLCSKHVAPIGYNLKHASCSVGAAYASRWWPSVECFHTGNTTEHRLIKRQPMHSNRSLQFQDRSTKLLKLPTGCLTTKVKCDIAVEFALNGDVERFSRVLTQTAKDSSTLDDLLLIVRCMKRLQIGEIERLQVLHKTLVTTFGPLFTNLNAHGKTLLCNSLVRSKQHISEWSLKLLQHWEELLQECNAVDVALLLQYVAKFCIQLKAECDAMSKNHLTFEEAKFFLLKKVLYITPELTAQGIASVSSSANQLNIDDPTLWRALADRLPAVLSDATPRQLSNVLQAFTQHPTIVSDLLDTISSHTTAHLPLFASRDLSMTFVAFSRISPPISDEASNCFTAVCQLLKKTFDACSTIDICCIAGNIFVFQHLLGKTDVSFVDALNKRIIDILPEVTNKQITLIADAYSKLKLRDEKNKVIAAIERELMAPKKMWKRVHQLNPQELWKLLNAFNKSDINSSTVLEAAKVFDSRLKVIIRDDNVYKGGHLHVRSSSNIQRNSRVKRNPRELFQDSYIEEPSLCFQRLHHPPNTTSTNGVPLCISQLFNGIGALPFDYKLYTSLFRSAARYAAAFKYREMITIVSSLTHKEEELAYHSHRVSDDCVVTNKHPPPKFYVALHEMLYTFSYRLIRAETNYETLKGNELDEYDGDSFHRLIVDLAPQAAASNAVHPKFCSLIEIYFVAQQKRFSSTDVKKLIKYFEIISTKNPNFLEALLQKISPHIKHLKCTELLALATTTERLFHGKQKMQNLKMLANALKQTTNCSFSLASSAQFLKCLSAAECRDMKAIQLLIDRMTLLLEKSPKQALSFEMLSNIAFDIGYCGSFSTFIHYSIKHKSIELLSKVFKCLDSTHFDKNGNHHHNTLCLIRLLLSLIFWNPPVEIMRCHASYLIECLLKQNLDSIKDAAFCESFKIIAASLFTEMRFTKEEFDSKYASMMEYIYSQISQFIDESARHDFSTKGIACVNYPRLDIYDEHLLLEATCDDALQQHNTSDVQLEKQSAHSDCSDVNEFDVRETEASLHSRIFKCTQLLSEVLTNDSLTLQPTLLGSSHPFGLKIADMKHKISFEVGNKEDFYEELDGTRLEWKAIKAVRHRLLTKLGWKVIRIPYYEWETLMDQSSEIYYMRKKILQSFREFEETQKQWNSTSDSCVESQDISVKEFDKSMRRKILFNQIGSLMK